ncbi:MAG TPA: PhoH family protein [Candidatus Glassbacteria bacterium]|nr:PhoH family protein [Candidatus Glassbacteria bacterium]
MHKTYVLDSSVIVHDPKCFANFKDNTLIIPVSVLEELDHIKSRADNAGAHARKAIRYLDEITSGDVDVNKGIDIGNNTIVVIDITKRLSKEKFSIGNQDDHILSCADFHKESVLVSKDINMRLRARAFGIKAQDYKADKISIDELFTGHREIDLHQCDLNIDSTKSFEAKKYSIFDNLFPNECVKLLHNGTSSIMRKHGDGYMIPIRVPEKVWGLKSRNQEQAYALDLLLDPNVPLVTLSGPAGTGKSLVAVSSILEQVIENKKYSNGQFYRSIISMGKELGYVPGPQPLDAKVLTPSGWTDMGSIKPGSLVIAKNGNPTKVIDVFPKGKKEIYKVTTTEGTSTECCLDHLWITKTSGFTNKDKSWSVKTTKKILKTINKNEKPNHILPRNNIVNFKEKEVPLPAYTLGALIGDGSCGYCIYLSNKDNELLEKVSKELTNFNCDLSKQKDSISYHLRCKSYEYKGKYTPSVKITCEENGACEQYESVGLAAEKTGTYIGTLKNRCKNNLSIDGYNYTFVEKDSRWCHPIKNIIYDLGLYQKKAQDKFVPNLYKYNSVKIRIELLRGLMDSDGTINKKGCAVFYTSSKTLASDVAEIVRSLSGRAVIHCRQRTGNKIKFNFPSYEVVVSMPIELNPFYIKRKASRHVCKAMHKQRIKSIEYVGEKEVQCILIEDPEHLYITDNYMVTHNTLQEKLDPWMGSTKDSISFLSGKNYDAFMHLYKDKISMEALSYIRGRSLNNSIIMLEEAQNISKHEIKTIITRVGIGSKIIIVGDQSQIDNHYLDSMDNGLTYVIEKFKNSYLSGHVTLVKGERSELATEASLIL